LRAIHVTDFGGPEVLQQVELPRPSPISTELLVEVRAAGVNPVDWKTRSGRGVSAWVGPPPFVPGWDVAGMVVDTGFGVTLFERGDRVFGMPWFPRAASAYAEFVTAPSRQFARIPNELSFEEAAAMPLAALTAWQALVETAELSPGQTILIHGASGGVGHLAVQIAKARGANVIGTASAAKHEWLASLGADQLVDYRDVEVKDAASGVDVVLDLVGRHENLGELKTLRDGGLLLAVPNGASEEAKHEAEKRDIGVAELLVEPEGHAMQEIAAMVKGGRLRVELDRTFPLEDAAKAHEMLESGGVRGKLALTI
jgi:NADPH:quinone reductase-like Zn-dependent oxidoreductase